MAMARLVFPATERNREPILAVLTRVLPPRSLVLEVASGSGEHAAYFAERLDVTWQPSDPDPVHRASIDDWCAGLCPPALDLDAAKPWPIDRADVVFCANMVHIAPWEACLGLLAGALTVLAPGGLLVMYGPFLRHGAHTSPSNEAFDASLRARNPTWGVRDLDVIASTATAFALDEEVVMPSNNFTVVFRRLGGVVRP